MKFIYNPEKIALTLVKDYYQTAVFAVFYLTGEKIGLEIEELKEKKSLSEIENIWPSWKEVESNKVRFCLIKEMQYFALCFILDQLDFFKNKYSNDNELENEIAKKIKEICFQNLIKSLEVLSQNASSSGFNLEKSLEEMSEQITYIITRVIEYIKFRGKYPEKSKIERELYENFKELDPFQIYDNYDSYLKNNIRKELPEKLKDDLLCNLLERRINEEFFCRVNYYLSYESMLIKTGTKEININDTAVMDMTFRIEKYLENKVSYDYDKVVIINKILTACMERIDLHSRLDSIKQQLR